jgi:competence protein ComEC
VHFVDVGQGDATLLRAPDATMLVDAGTHDGSDVVPYLEAIGVDTLDLVAITHPHADHLGQFDRVMERFDVAEVWWSGATHTTRTFERALAALEAGDAAYEEPRAGDTTSVGSLEITVVNPPGGADDGDLHDSGLAFRVTYGGVAFLFTGDAEAPTEQRMTGQAADRLTADVYQVGHHGSRTSTSSAFLDAVDPAVAVYSARPGNQYGHPHAEVVARLVDAGVELYGTAVHGTVVVTTDGQGWAVATERDMPPVTAVAVSEQQPEAEPAPASPAQADGCAPGQVDINTAGLVELQRITQIGPERARQIIDLRPFAGLDALTRVPGIADGRLQQIKDQGLACA